MSAHADETLRLVSVLDYASAESIRLGDYELAADPARQVFIRAGEGYPLAVAHMGQAIYEHAYSRGDVAGFVRAVQPRKRAGQEGQSPPPGATPPFPGLDSHEYPDRLLPDDFAAHLDAAHTTTATDEGGWTVQKVEGTQLSIVHVTGVRTTVAQGAWKGEAAVGAEGRIATPRSSNTRQAGWYTLRGNEPHYTSRNGTVRLYWNLTRFGASAFVHHVSRALNAQGTPFNLKLTANPQRFGRADGGVLYVASASWPDVAAALPDVYAAVGPYLRPRVPLFTKEIAPGVGLAEDPAGGDGESFGMSRSRLVAEGVWDAWKAGASEPTARLEAVRARFLAAGLSLDRPHLASDKEDPYVVQLARRTLRYAEEVVA